MIEFKNIVQNIKDNNLDEALELCKKFENIQNSHIISNFKGVIYTQKENFKLAEESFLRSIKFNDKFIEPTKNLYLLYLKYKNYSKLLEYAIKLISFESLNPTYNYFLAYAYELNNEPDNAIKFYKINIDLNGKEKKRSFNNIGSIFSFTKKYKTALEFFLEAYRIDKSDKLIANNVFQTYLLLRDIKNSDILFDICNGLDPNYKEFIKNRCEHLFLKKNIKEAIDLLEKNKKKDLDYLLKLIHIYYTIGETDRGSTVLKEAIEKNINHPRFDTSLSLRLLFKGDFENGFKLYENRSSKNINHFKDIKEWNGENLRNKSIIVYSEQGLGDAIQFSKYLIPLSKIAQNIKFFVQDSIFDLFDNKINNLKISSIKSIDHNVADFKITLGSLIKFFYNKKINTNELSIKAEEKNKNYFKKIINKNKLNVGLVWSGFIYGSGQPYRSIQLEKFEKILNLDANFFCLQDEVWEDDLPFLKKSKLKNYGHLNLKDISALIENLDLIVTVDTLFLHLASSLNKETWALLCIDPDWRWGELNKFNPYNNTRIFVQEKFDDWEVVLDKVYNQIKLLIK